jgi:D-3-phosphoglycerate dehydrogenase
VPDFSTEEVADHAMAMLLSAARQLKTYEAAMRAGRQPHDVPHMRRLSTQTVGVLGFGRIGRTFASRAGAFGLTVLACDPAAAKADARREGAELVDLPALLARSDYLVLMCPLNNSTRGMIGWGELSRMKPSAVLVNVARGEVVNEADLVRALREKVIRYACLDVFAGINVFDPQGFATDHPLFGLDNVLLTPHVAAYSQEAVVYCCTRGAQAVVDALAGRRPATLVNPQVQPWYLDPACPGPLA